MICTVSITFLCKTLYLFNLYFQILFLFEEIILERYEDSVKTLEDIFQRYSVKHHLTSQKITFTNCSTLILSSNKHKHISTISERQCEDCCHDIDQLRHLVGEQCYIIIVGAGDKTRDSDEVDLWFDLSKFQSSLIEARWVSFVKMRQFICFGLLTFSH